MNYYENFYKEYEYIAGVDEVGRGCIFGPVVACCVILPSNFDYIDINDSKLLSKKRREILYEYIISNCIDFSISVISNEIVDDINVLEASKKAMIQSINDLKVKPDVVLIDALKLDVEYETKSIIKGDQKSYSIASASIIAKVFRDKLMVEYAKKFPYYGLETNAGYPTKKHLEAIDKFGITKYHRKTFSPVTNYIRKNLIGVE